MGNEPNLASLLSAKAGRVRSSKGFLTKALCATLKAACWSASDEGLSKVTVSNDSVNQEVIDWAKGQGLKYSYDDGSPEEGNSAGAETHTFSWAKARCAGCENCECAK